MGVALLKVLSIALAVVLVGSGAVVATAPSTAQAVTISSADAAAAKLGTRSAGLHGVNVAGAEFSTLGVPTFDNLQSYQYLASRGHSLLRIPVKWESIQPTLSGPLSPLGIASLSSTVGDATSAKVSVVIDIHNYAAFNKVTYGTAGSFTSADFADLWTRLSVVFKNNPTVVGYGLMNEPRGIPSLGDETGNVRWQKVQQEAVNAIRANGDATCILVSGYTSASMGTWRNAVNGQPVPYIVDPLDNMRWEAHHYWDAGTTGKYTTTYAQAVAAGWGTKYGDGARTRTLFELDAWLMWLKDNGQRGFIGEFGWPSAQNAKYPADVAAWDSLATSYLQRLSQEAPGLTWSTVWATGDRWEETYPLQFYGSNGSTLAAPLTNASLLEREGPDSTAGSTAGVSGTTVPTSSLSGADSQTADSSAAQKSATSTSARLTKSLVHKTGRARVNITIASEIPVSGTVTVRNGSTVIVRGAPLVNGKASIVLPRLKPGAKRITVYFNGSSALLKSKSKTLDLRVRSW